MTIKKEDYEACEQVILSGQMPHESVPAFLEQNPEFKMWYLERRHLLIGRLGTERRR